LAVTLGTQAAPGNEIPRSGTQESSERGHDGRQENTAEEAMRLLIDGAMV
jgi:hypothetical protein